MSGARIAIAGATGAVGVEMLRVLEDRGFAVSEMRALASARSVGKKLAFGGGEVEVEELRPEAFDGVDFALFSAGGDQSRRFAPAAVERGAIVIDNSSAFRMDPKVPLVVPECNPEALASHEGVIANPNCSTIILVVALAPLHRAAGLRRVIVSTYQAASGAGQKAVDELRAATAARLAGEDFRLEALPHSLAFNLFARIDVFTGEGYTKEEDKMLFETRKILSLPDLPVEATCVRVPVERCHAEAVSVELERRLDPEAAQQLFAGAPGLELVDDTAADLHPQPQGVAGRDEVGVGRVRGSRAFEPGLSFWLVGDQLRKGAAQNAVQILEALQH